MATLRRAVMDAHFLGEGPSRPTFHSCSDESDIVNAAPLERSVSPDILEAFPPKQLAYPWNIIDTRKHIVVSRFGIFNVRRSYQPQPAVFSELLKQECKEISIERNITVKAANRVVFHPP